MNNKLGMFITVEGGEGVGKTTNMLFIENWLNKKNIKYTSTREPGGTPLAENIRELLLTPSDELINENTELLLMFAARAQHLSQVILPSLKQGKWVLCDRFTDASFAYQGGGRGMSDKKISLLENFVQGTLRPDLTILLDIPVKDGLKRALSRSKPDRFEQEQIEFFDRVRKTYIDRSKKFPKQYKVIDASKNLDQVELKIEVILEEFLKKSCKNATEP
ncbi:MAG: dTMP kinase [Gammaproteobacteria bacterium]|jgi:dTMP kinase|nr:dTMP kinase [Gammaproteobacteria bacterium]MDC1093708.1 dTMP kinase [Porticoccus sp.]